MAGKKKQNKDKETEHRLTTLEVSFLGVCKDIKTIRTDFSDMKKNHLSKIYKKLDTIEKDLYTRPSWFVAKLITFLVSSVTALAVYLLTKS